MTFAESEHVRPTPDATATAAWYCDGWFWLMVLCVALIYGWRLDAGALHGEETRRAQVAAEMIWHDDYIVPRQQGQIYLSRPPLGNWPIALLAKMRGELDRISARLPSVIAIVLTCILIYRFARSFLSTTGALTSAFAYATSLQVLQLGRLAETEAIFSLCVSASLLGWFWAKSAGRPAWQYWSFGYAAAACAGLTKGLQGPVYFLAVTGVYMIGIERNWRALFSRGHFAGVLVLVGIIACWQIPYVQVAGWENAKSIWMDQAANRFGSLQFAEVTRHFLTYPLEILACTMPWSSVLVQFFNPQTRTALSRYRPQIVFLVTCLVVTFPSVWFSPHARSRYYMPLYPVIAILAGMIVQAVSEGARDRWRNHGWLLMRYCFAIIAVVAGLGTTLILAGIPASKIIPVPIVIGFVFIVIAIASAYWLTKTSRLSLHSRVSFDVLAITLLTGFAWIVVGVSVEQSRQRNVATDLATIRERIALTDELVSFGRIDHAFTYKFGRLIPQRDWPENGKNSEPLPLWFCARKADLDSHSLPFAWETVGEFSLSPEIEVHPRKVIVIGRRLAKQQFSHGSSRRQISGPH